MKWNLFLRCAALCSYMTVIGCSSDQPTSNVLDTNIEADRFPGPLSLVFCTFYTREVVTDEQLADKDYCKETNKTARVRIKRNKNNAYYYKCKKSNKWKSLHSYHYKNGGFCDIPETSKDGDSDNSGKGGFSGGGWTTSRAFESCKRLGSTELAKPTDLRALFNSSSEDYVQIGNSLSATHATVKKCLTKDRCKDFHIKPNRVYPKYNYQKAYVGMRNNRIQVLFAGVNKKGLAGPKLIWCSMSDAGHLSCSMNFESRTMAGKQTITKFSGAAGMKNGKINCVRVGYEHIEDYKDSYGNDVKLKYNWYAYY